MKATLLMLTIMISLSTYSQSRNLWLIIEDIESVKATPCDSIEIELTNQGFANMGEQTVIRTAKVNEKRTLTKYININSDSTTLKVYFNRHGFIEIGNLYGVKSDTLKILKFSVFLDCLQKGTWSTKTVFENDNVGETDFLNYKTEITSDFHLKPDVCGVPDSLSIVINGESYKEEIIKFPQQNLVKSRHGMTRKFWIGEKRYFHFKEVEMMLIRKGKIDLI